MTLRASLRARGIGGAEPAMLTDGASFAHAFGAVLVFLLAVEAVTGFALAAFYSPSSTQAWASVAYIQDQATLGWLVRGIHHHGGGAIVVVAGIHLVQTALYGAYKKPRELVWWLGILLLVLTLAWAVTGYVLRWDQAGYWANKVEIGIAAATPVVGGAIKQLALGGNDYGNLTLTRFYALHVIALPVVVGAVTYVHVKLARKYGPTPRVVRAPAPRWPDQVLRDAIAMALVFAILLGYVASTHGVGLAAPADPSAAYDARPLWYFRWLFELRDLAGGMEKLAALAAPAVVAGVLVALPLLDRKDSRAIKLRLPWVGAVAGIVAAIAALTVMSFAGDSSNADLAKREAAAAEHADRARQLARDNGVPVTGAQDVYATAPMWTARTIYTTRCKGCHEDGHERKGPLIGPGHGDRAWLTGFLKAPSGEAYYAHTKLGASDGAMKPVDLAPAELDDLVEMLYAESGATDVDADKRTRGMTVFDNACDSCHSREDGVSGSSAPGLGGLGSRDYYRSFVGNPKSGQHMGPDKSQMPRFDKELTLAERDAIAEYLVWLRTASRQDLDALGPL